MPTLVTRRVRLLVSAALTLLFVAMPAGLVLAADPPKPKAVIAVGPPLDIPKSDFDKEVAIEKQKLEEAGYDVTVDDKATQESVKKALDDTSGTAFVFVGHAR